jgi:hypothetical protein
MSQDTYERGRDDARDGEYNPPGDTLGETLSSETNRYYEHKRDDYQRGYDDMKNEIEHDKK